MTEVISAILQKGLSTSACVDQLDIANNHYGSSMVWPRSPKDFALEEGDMDGFEPAVGKLRKNGFVCVEGLLDAEIAAAVHANCSEQFWARRGAGAMRPAGGAASAGHECWVPYPPRRGTPPELGHALRILFGLPREIERHGYPVRLKVPPLSIG
ncbi:unnamed protein product [Prorocentrum cordatum]|uniref:Uncharacterized protein n=1 Tax=Prorocentrum cordatum TaxID=2364126 RepID=A0ABN9T931_9DINO|nr:unnamed protein product [Polarella glacialis]